ncbi:MAG: hypothetical protein C0417_05400 [Chlorobiaceae bacterium]|nr:hypothetical protein [Chlorobiaceae bacterium]
MIALVFQPVDVKYPINISGAKFPLKMSWEIVNRMVDGELLVGSDKVALNQSGEVILKDEVDDITLILKKRIAVPHAFALEQNYPNPFNPTTNFQFSIANMPAGVRGTQAGSQLTILKVYDVLGREVETLLNEVLNPGTYNVKWDATKYSSGVYFYKLHSGNFTEIKKMLLVR